MEAQGTFFLKRTSDEDMLCNFALRSLTYEPILDITICSTATVTKEGQTLAFIAICTDEHKWQAPQDLFYDIFSFVMEKNLTIISVF